MTSRIPEPPSEMEAEGIPDPGTAAENQLATGQAEGVMTTPRDTPVAADDFGTTAAEMRDGESLDGRIAREEPDVLAAVDLPADESATADTPVRRGRGPGHRPPRRSRPGRHLRHREGPRSAPTSAPTSAATAAEESADAPRARGLTAAATGRRAAVTRLRRISCSAPGLTRRRRGKGFSYVDAAGNPVTTRPRWRGIAALVIPPAWQDVWICPISNGHVQATGVDAKGRRPVPLPRRWRLQRDLVKHDRCWSSRPGCRRRASGCSSTCGATDALTRDRVLACACA
jgi:hypothetical protein